MAKKSAAQKELESLKKQLKDIGSFSYTDNYKTNADNYYGTVGKMLSNPAAYGFNKYQTDVDEVFNQLMNMEKFSYDPQTDQLFQMYKKQYNAQGTRAMKNAMGVGAAYSGGYNSSAAQTAAQSTYNTYLDALNDKVSETYQNALNMYKQNQQNLIDRYNITSDMNKASNDAYWSTLNANNTAAKTTYDVFNGNRQFEFGKWSDRNNNLVTRLGQTQQQVNWEKDNALNAKRYKG